TDCGIEFLEPPSGSHERAAGAESGDEMSDADRSLFPDFGGSGAIVRLPISRIAVLIGIKIFFGLCGDDLVHFADGAVGAFIARSADEFRAEGRKDPFALVRSAVWQTKLNGKTECCA